MQAAMLGKQSRGQQEWQPRARLRPGQLSNFYQTVQWHTNCFCVNVDLPSWERSEQRWKMPSVWTRRTSRAALDPLHLWSIPASPLPFLPLSPAHPQWRLLMELVASAETGVQESPAVLRLSRGKRRVLEWFPSVFLAPLLPHHCEGTLAFPPRCYCRLQFDLGLGTDLLGQTDYSIALLLIVYHGIRLRCGDGCFFLAVACLSR